MMMRKILYLIVILFAGYSSFSQCSLEGKIYNIDDNKSLSNANILIKELNIGAVSNAEGYFKIEDIKEGYYNICVSYIGYEENCKKIFISDKMLNKHNFFLIQKVQNLSDVSITASRIYQNTNEVPASISILKSKQIEDYPCLNVDEVLHMIPGARTDRSNGIYSKNASVTLRGLNGSYRTLVLIDNVPINKSDGGGLNWNRMNPDDIERIEVLKGPNSAIYGGNAMGGVINILTKKTEDKFSLRAKAFYGTYNSYGGELFLGSSFIKKDKGFYFKGSGFIRKGEGYIIQPDSLRDSNCVDTYLTEYNAQLKVGYQFRQNSTLEIEGGYYYDKRGAGYRIFEPDGSYDSYPTQFARIKFDHTIKKTHLIITAFYQYEHYLRQQETVKKQTGKYTLFNTDSKRQDFGLWTTAVTAISENQNLIYGLDIKQGNVDGSDIYYTSTDVLTNKGMMNNAALFAQFEQALFKRKFIINAGLRFDVAQFTKGSFNITEPTVLSDIIVPYCGDYNENLWTALSPKIGLLYQINNNSKVYLSYSKGFRVGTLDDMCKNGNITKGVKLANPELKPETLNNIEAGYTINYKNLTIDHSIYYSIGNNFQYFVGTGDSIDNGGDKLKPVLKRENISQVQIYGTEISVSYSFFKHFNLTANYAYCHSTILKFDTAKYVAKDLTGKFLMEVPPNQFSSGFEYRNRFMSCGIFYYFVDKQWYDDENTIVNPAYSSFDFKISTRIKDFLFLSVTVQDIFNQKHTDNKGYLSPGRFIMANVVYKFNLK
jgi:iron complex outermembrane receptor protein